MEKLTIPIKGIHCNACTITIKKILGDSEGVVSCDVNYGNEKVKIEFDPLKTTVAELNKKIEPFGYSLDISTIKNKTDKLKL